MGELGNWTGGGTPSKDVEEFWRDGTIPWVSPKDMKQGAVGNKAEKITHAAVENSAVNVIAEGSLLCVIRSGILNHTFPVALAECDVTINQDMKALTSHDGISADYIRLFLTSCNDEILHTCSKDGTTVASIEMSNFKNLPVPVAPTSEQDRICSAVGLLFGDLDEAEAALVRAKVGVEQFRASLLHAACTGQLTAAWRQANPPTETGADLLRRILAERRVTWERTERARLQAKGTLPKGDAWKARYVEPASPDTRSMPQLPAGWVWASLGQLTSKITSGSRDWGDYYTKEGAILIRAQNIKTDQLSVSDLAHVKSTGVNGEARTIVYRNDLLITITGANVTKSAIVNVDLGTSYVSQHVGLCRPVLPELAKFLHLTAVCGSLGRKQLQEAAYGAGKPGLNLQDLARTILPLPPVSEQTEICKLFAAVSELDCNILDHAAASGQTAMSLRQSILHAAFTGRLVPQNPDDEPAETLLERLRVTEAPARRTRRRAPAEARV